MQKADSARSSAIKNMPAPAAVSTLQAFLGLANYYGNLYPKYAHIYSYSK